VSVAGVLEGFKEGPSAENYISISGASRAIVSISRIIHQTSLREW
jgi:hypothetical protein